MMDPSISATNASAIAMLLTSREDKEFELYKLLLRMALSDNTLPSLAIRFAISALAHLHMRRSSEASLFQIKAVSALSQSINREMGTEEGLKTMAASMLLNIYEVVSGTASAMSWTVFFCGCKRISKMVYGHDETYEGDLATLLDWVFYHDVLYKFSILHWTQRVEEQRQLAKEPKMISKQIYSPSRSIILSSLGCSLELLDTLTLVFDNVLDREDPLYLSEEHERSMRSLELRLENIQQECRIGEIEETQLQRDTSNGIAELYRLSALIYLERVARGASKASLKATKWVQDAFKILENLRSCERPFPLFVIAVEACTDYQKAIILKVIASTIEERPLGAISSVKRMIEAAWVQDDLNLEQELDSLLKYNSVISANSSPPAFT
ncbi:hypothetical protein N431DRAFT_553212 [Stipitochalara longipes BDJ]|nr:hypothetical protein N431DRAFT_553212 [Stipitochalara longipes BDJ]